MDVRKLKTDFVAGFKRYFSGLKLSKFRLDEFIITFIVMGVMSLIAANLTWAYTLGLVIAIAVVIAWMED